jgi:hypothetical protein
MSNHFEDKLASMDVKLNAILKSQNEVTLVEEAKMLLDSVKQLTFALSEIRTSNGLLENAALIAPDFTNLFDETVSLFEEFCELHSV